MDALNLEPCDLHLSQSSRIVVTYDVSASPSGHPATGTWHLYNNLYRISIFHIFRQLSKYQIIVNQVFKALNDPIRRKILELLKKRGDMSAGEIAAQFEISKPSISHHLDLLKQAGLVQVMRDGQFLYYSLNTTIIDELLKWTIKLSSKK